MGLVKSNFIVVWLWSDEVAEFLSVPFQPREVTVVSTLRPGRRVVLREEEMNVNVSPKAEKYTVERELS